MTACTPSSASAALESIRDDASVRARYCGESCRGACRAAAGDGCTRRCRSPWRAPSRRGPIDPPRDTCSRSRSSSCVSRSACHLAGPMRVQRRGERPAYVHPHHLALVGGAAADVGERLDLLGGRVAGRRKRRPSRGSAPASAASAPATRTGRSVAALTATRASAMRSAVRAVPDGHADRRPVVGRQRRVLRVPRVHAGRLRGHLDLGDQLVAAIAVW